MLQAFSSIKDIVSQLKSHLIHLPLPVTPREVNALFYGPSILVVSCPKSGTHLLNSLINHLPMIIPRWHYSIVNGRLDNVDQFTIYKGQYVSSHLFWDEKLYNHLIEQKVRIIFIIRDLRDIAVSRAFYHTYKLKTHPIFDHMQQLNSNEERIKLAILGSQEAEMGFPSLATWVKNYIPWIHAPECMAVTFEDLVGSRGGGSDQKQYQVVSEIIRHVGYNNLSLNLESVVKQIYSEKSSTFRKGIIGDWKNYFSDEHKAIFKEQIGDFLIKLSYVRDHDW